MDVSGEFNLSGSNSPQLAAISSGSLTGIPRQLAAGSFIMTNHCDRNWSGRIFAFLMTLAVSFGLSASAWALDPPTAISASAQAILYTFNEDNNNCTLFGDGKLRCLYDINIRIAWSKDTAYGSTPSSTDPYWSYLVFIFSDTHFPSGYVVGSAGDYSGLTDVGGQLGKLTDEEAQAFVQEFFDDNFRIVVYYKTPDGVEHSVSSNPGKQVPMSVPQDQALKQSLPNNNICRADPVYMHSGQFYYQCNDVSIPGRKLDLNVMHAYFGGSFYNGRFGYEWRLAHDMRLHELVNDDVVIVTGGGQKNKYTRSGSDYSPPAGRFETLVKNGNGTWTLTFAHGEQYQFNAQGNLTAIEDRNDNTIALAYGSTATTVWGYSPYGQSPAAKIKIAVDKPLVAMTDTTGRQLDLNYNSDGLLGSIEDGSREWTFTYGFTTHDLLTITKPATTQFTSGVTKTFEYENHNVKKIKDGKGNYFVENTYDDEGRVTVQKLGETSNETMTFDYNTADQVTEFDRNGFKKVYGFNSTGNMTSRRDYTNLNLRSGEPDYFETLYTYNGDSLLTSVKYPRGNGVKNTYDSSNSNRRARGNLLELRRKTDMTAADNNTNDIVTAMTYESSFNQPDMVTDPKGNVTTYTYDFELPTNDPKYGTRGDLIKITYPTVAAGTPVTEFSYNSYGQVTEVIDPNGNTTQYTYGSTTGYLVSVSQDPTGINAITSFTYDANGYPDTVTDAENHTTNFDYDTLGWLNQVTDPLGYVTKHTYDANGNIIKTEKQANTAGTLWQTTEFTYDVLNHIKTLKDPLNRITTYNYDNNENLASTVDALNKTTTSLYDERNLLFTVTDANSPAGVTRYDYDINGSLAKLTDANANATNYTYDLFDRLTTTTYADTSTEQLTYDKNSNAATRTTPNAQQIQYTYDNLNRLTNQNYPSNSALNITNVYDLGSRLTSSANSYSTNAFTYDNLNRALTNTQALTGASYTVNYAYNDLLQTGVTYPSSKNVTYAYNADNLLTALNVGGSALMNLTYDTLNRRAQKDLTGSATKQVSYTFNLANELTTLENKIQGGAAISKHDYTYDNVSNRLTHNITAAANKNYSYTYNNIYELTGVSGSETSSFAYDKLGNRTTSNGISYTTNNLNQYTAVNSVTHNYDTNGNLTGDGINTYGYDVENRLSSFSKSGTTASYTYDSFNRRVSKTVNGTTTYFVYDGDDIIEERAVGGALNANYVHGNGTDEPLTMTRAGSTYYYYSDGLGSTRELTDSAGVVQETYSYSSFGQLSSTPVINNPYAFTGREYDPESGNYHYRRRTYDPITGSFLQRDPTGYVDGMNLFTYAHNSPTNYIDPDGELAFLALLPLAYAAFEFTLSAVDAYSTGSTLLDPCASGGEKLASAGAFLVGALAPGGGYSTGVKALQKIGKAGKNKGIREVVGNASDAGKIFNSLRGTNKVIQKKPGVFVAETSGGGFVTFRKTSSQNGPPTLDINIPGEDFLKIKFVNK